MKTTREYPFASKNKEKKEASKDGLCMNKRDDYILPRQFAYMNAYKRCSMYSRCLYNHARDKEKQRWENSNMDGRGEK